MTIQDAAAIISTAALVYFCIGTYRIDRKLGETNEHLQDIRDFLAELKKDIQ